MPAARVLCLADVDTTSLEALMQRYGIGLEHVACGQPITGSYWGEPEAGVVGDTVYGRDDTPVHSLLHEAGHVICMGRERRSALFRDAGGDDAEECAVCFLQVLLAERLPGVGRERIMRDMDTWGYSFRLGSTARWFATDAGDAQQWLLDRNLLARDGDGGFHLQQP